MSAAVADMLGPQVFPRAVIGRDELGYPALAHDCPVCGACALIVNEWNAVECLTCTWREFSPDSPRAEFIDWEDDLAGDGKTYAEMNGR